MRSPGFSTFNSFFGGGAVGRGLPAEDGGASLAGARLGGLGGAEVLGGAELGGGLELELGLTYPPLPGLGAVAEYGILEGGGFGFRTLLLLLELGRSYPPLLVAEVRDHGGSGALLVVRMGAGGGRVVLGRALGDLEREGPRLLVSGGGSGASLPLLGGNGARLLTLMADISPPGFRTDKEDFVGPGGGGGGAAVTGRWGNMGSGISSIGGGSGAPASARCALTSSRSVSRSARFHLPPL